MIENQQQYGKALEELADLEQWLAQLRIKSPLPEKGLTRAGIRKLIARLHEELAIYEGSRETETMTLDKP